MDCTGRTMNICLILFVISITGGQGQFYSNRDIILTPHQLKTYPGKVLYYRPRDHPAPTPTEEKANGAVPWEEVLKETVFLALNDNKTSHQQQQQATSSGSTLLDNAPLVAAVKRQQKAIYNAPYVGAIDLSVPRFGDIVELAHGRLERDADEEDSYVFIQQQRPEDGGESDAEEGAPAKPRNLTALWKVERIRHRDEQRGHRYELKFTIVPGGSVGENASNTEEHPPNRTFIVRDEDYPRYFGLSSPPPNAIVPSVIMLRKNDQPLYDRTFFDLLQPPATRYYRPAPQPTITLGQYLVQSLLSGGDAPKYHHHQHHLMPSGKFSFPTTTLYTGASSGRIKFPDSFTTASHSVPKFYQHIHFPRPSIAPLAPTAVPGAFLFAKDTHAPAPSNIHQDYTKVAPAQVQEPSQEAPRPNQVVQKPQQQQQQTVRPKQFGSQFPSQPQAPLVPQQQQPHVIYRPQQQQQQAQVQQQSPQQQPIFIHPQSVSGPGPYLQGAMAGPFSAPQQSHFIQSIPFYSPQGPMVLNHIPVMSNHHHHLAIQMAPPAPIAIPVHLQLLPPPAAAQIYASPAPQQDGLQAIPVRIMQSFPNPPPPPSFHLYSSSPVNPFLPPPAFHQQRHPIVTVTPKTTTHSAAANQTSSLPPSSSSPSTTIGHHHHPSHPHHHQHQSHKATSGHPFSALPTVFKFTSSNAIHPQTGPTPPPHHRHTAPLLVQLSGPSIGPPSQRGHPHRFSTPAASTPSTAALGIRSSTAPVTFPPSPTAATRPRSTVAVVGQVSGPTAAASSTHHHHRSSAALPTVPASPAGLREKFSAPALQPTAGESKQVPRKLDPPADTVGAPSNAVSPKYESFGVENAVTPTGIATVTATTSLLRSSPSTLPGSGSSFGTSLRPGFSSTSFSNFIDASGAVSVTAKLTAASESPAPRVRPPVSSPTTPLSIPPLTTQPTYVPSKPKTTYIQQLGPTIGGKYPPAFKSMPSVTILPPQIETPISSTLKTYQYLTHHHHQDTYDFIPSRVVELAHVKKLAGQKQHSGKRSKQQKAAAAAVNAANGGSHHKQHHHVTVTSNKPLRFYPGDGPEHATHRPEAQLSVQLPPPEKELTTTYYGTPKHNQKVQRPKNFVTPLHPYQGPASTTPMPAVTTAQSSSSSSSSVAPPASASTTPEPTVARNTSTSTFRSATASSTAHYYTKNRHEKSDDLTTMSITTMRPRMVLKTLYRQFPASFLPSTSTVSGSSSSSVSTEKPVQKWLPKRPRTKSTSGEYAATSTLPSSSSASDPVAVASSDHAPDVVTKLPLITVPSVTVAQQMSARVRASRGRSRFTYRRIPSGNPPPPPIPTGQQQQATRMGRMRTVSAWATTTTTPKPISSVVDGNRIDSSYEQQERRAEQTVMGAAPTTDKIKRDAVAEPAVAEQLVAKQVDSGNLEVPEQEYVMVKASVQPVQNTNVPPNVLFFEASDATTPAEVARTLGSTIEDLTMSIINHAKAIVNQTGPMATESVTTSTSTTGKPIESNEISHREETTVQQDDPQDTSRSPVIDETVATEGVTAAGETTIATTIASTTLDDVELDADTDTDDERRTTAIAYLS